MDFDVHPFDRIRVLGGNGSQWSCSDCIVLHEDILDGLWFGLRGEKGKEIARLGRMTSVGSGKKVQ